MAEPLDGPEPQLGVGIVASFDFNRDRELWRWAPDHVTLFIARTAPVTSREGFALVKALNDPDLLERPTREVVELDARVVAYHCTACSFVGGVRRERQLQQAMRDAGADRTLTTSSAAVEALGAVGARSVAVAHPYVPAVGERLTAYLEENDFTVVDSHGLGLQPAEIPGVRYPRVRELIRASDHPDADAIFVSCTALATYDVIAPLEAELGKPIVTANQATVWASLNALGIAAVGPEQRLIAGSVPVT